MGRFYILPDKNKVKMIKGHRIHQSVIVCLIIAVLFAAFPITTIAATFNIGDTVEVITNLNVRVGPGLGYSEITDPDYPGYAPTGTRGTVVDGPTSADSYVWWKVDYGPGLYLGWSVEGGLQKIITQPDLTVTSVNAPISAESGGFIAVSWTVRNQGDAPSGPFFNRISLATTPFGTDISLGNYSMGSIMPSSSSSDAQVPKIPESVSPGNYYVTVYADSFTSIAESNENNNINKAPSMIQISIPTEVVSTPNTPSGPSTGTVGTSYTYATSGSTSNMGHAIQYRFNWGDGYYSSWSSSSTASHSWANHGTYSIRAQARCATHTSIVSSWSSIRMLYIPPPSPVADFIASPTEGPVPLTVQFTDKSMGIINSWFWQFGDGNTSTVRNPSHTYNTPGSYSPRLTVTGPGGTDTVVIPNYIVVEQQVLTGTISGYVYQSDGQTPIEGAIITIWDFDTLPGSGSATYEAVRTNADGSYRTVGLPFGVYAVRVVAMGYAVEWYDDTHRVAEVTPVSVNPPNDTLGVDFVLAPGGSIIGHVYKADGTTPIRDARITVFEYYSQTNQWLHYFGGGARTDTEGYYRTGGLPSGQYKVRAYAKGYQEVFYDNTHGIDQATSISVSAPNNTYDVDFNLGPGITHVWTSETIRGPEVTEFPAGTTKVCVNYEYENPIGSIQKIVWHDEGNTFSGTSTHIAEHESGTGTWSLTDTVFLTGGHYIADLFINDILLATVDWVVEPGSPVISHAWTSDTIRGPAIDSFPAGTQEVYVNYYYVNPPGSEHKIVCYDSEGNALRTHTHVTQNRKGTGTWTVTYPGGNWPSGSYWADLSINDILLYSVSWTVGSVQYNADAHSAHFTSGYYIQLMVDDPDQTIQSVSVTGPGIDGSLSLLSGIRPDQWWSHPNVSLGMTPPSLPLVYTFTITEKSANIFIVKDVVLSYVEDFATNLSPANSEVVTGELVFSWTGIDLPDVSYQVQLNDSEDNRIWDSPIITNISYEYDGPALAPGNYQYYVSSRSTHGDESLASATFELGDPLPENHPPNRPIKHFPEDGMIDSNLVITLKAHPFSDPDPGDTCGNAHWQITNVAGDYSVPDFDYVGYSTHYNLIILPEGTLNYETTYYWHVRYQDNGGAWSEWSEETSFRTKANKPVVDFDFSPSFPFWPVVDQEIIFNASSSQPSDGATDILLYQWDFGETPLSTKRDGMEVRHTYWADQLIGGENKKSFQVTLTVTDNQRRSASRSRTVIVKRPPVVLVHGLRVSFFLSLGVLPPDLDETWGQLVEYLTDKDVNQPSEWDWVYDESLEFDPLFSMKRLEGNGFIVYVSNYSHTEVGTPLDIRWYAKSLANEITLIKKQEYVSKVDIVSHSMGGLVSRTYIENGDLENNPYVSPYRGDVRKLVILGTPNQGAYLADLFSGIAERIPGVDEMVNWQSVQQMEASADLDSGFITQLNNDTTTGLSEGVEYSAIAGNFYSHQYMRVLILKQSLVAGLANTLEYILPTTLYRLSNDEHDGIVNVNNVKLDEIPDSRWFVYPLDHSQLRTEDVSLKTVIEILTEPISSGESIEVPDLYIANLASPGELRISDSQGQITGLVNGEVVEEIQDSKYDEQRNLVMVFPTTDSYLCYVVGTGDGPYGLRVTSVSDGETSGFIAEVIPTNAGKIHLYMIDWDALSQGKEGVTIQIDTDGDGEFEKSITCDGLLTRDEFMLQTGTDIEVGGEIRPVNKLPLLVFWFAVAIALLADAAVIMKYSKSQSLLLARSKLKRNKYNLP
jgi:PKD repeat protein